MLRVSLFQKEYLSGPWLYCLARGANEILDIIPVIWCLYRVGFQ
jgi:hypothetical protein